VQVYLPRRGGRRLLFTVNVRDPSEIESTVLERLEDYKEEAELVKYKYLIAVDTKEDVEVKVNNPFFDEEAAQAAPSKVSPKEAIEGLKLDLIGTMHDEYKHLISGVFRGVTEVAIGTVKDVVNQIISERTRTGQLHEVSQLIGNIVELAKNWDKVKAMSNELAPMIKEYLEKGVLPKEEPKGGEGK
jgi:hypothetical protein